MVANKLTQILYEYNENVTEDHKNENNKTQR